MKCIDQQINGMVREHRQESGIYSLLLCYKHNTVSLYKRKYKYQVRNITLTSLATNEKVNVIKMSLLLVTFFCVDFFFEKFFFHTSLFVLIL